MKKRVSANEPLFNFLEVDATEVGRYSGLIDDILAKRQTGILIHGALPAEALEGAQSRIAASSVPFYKRAFEGFAESPAAPFMLGRVLVTADPDLERYFTTAAQTRPHLQALFAPELDLEARIGELLGAMAGKRPVRVPEGPQGQTYAPATIRSLPDGHGIGIHADNASARTPQMQELGAHTSVEQQLSFFFTLAAPHAGGELVVYGLEWDDVAASFSNQTRPDEILYDQKNSLLRLVDLCDSETIVPREGDLVVFDAGRYFHRVKPIQGPRARITLGGFLALSRDGTTLHHWS